MKIAKYYKTFSNIVEIRTISAEYLIAMKLRSGRQYKNDLSDVLGILLEHSKNGSQITYVQIQQAVIDLYGSWDSLPETSQEFINTVINSNNLEELYTQISNNEKETKSLLLQFNVAYPNAANEKNISEITETLQKKANQADILKLLKKNE